MQEKGGKLLYSLKSRFPPSFAQVRDRIPGKMKTRQVFWQGHRSNIRQQINLWIPPGRSILLGQLYPPPSPSGHLCTDNTATQSVPHAFLFSYNHFQRFQIRFGQSWSLLLVVDTHFRSSRKRGCQYWSPSNQQRLGPPRTSFLYPSHGRLLFGSNSMFR